MRLKLDDAVFLLSPRASKIVSIATSRPRPVPPASGRTFLCSLLLSISVFVIALLHLWLSFWEVAVDVPPFFHLSSTKDVDCFLLFQNSSEGREYAQKLATRRITYKDEDSLATDCHSIRARGYFPESPLSEDEADFPIAFARIVYKDYYFLESQLRVEYAPQNAFCYSLDAKADAVFKKRMRSLATCFPNVIVPEVEVDVRSEGHNMTLAHLACLRQLRTRVWKYVVLLQNHDVSLRTNAEMVRILRNFNGANDISATMPGPHTFDADANWTMAALHLFKHEPLNLLRDARGELVRLQVTKSLVQVSISREAVDFVMDELNPALLIRQLESKGFGVDELFWATLNTDDTLALPGGFTRQCLRRASRVSMATRLTSWINSQQPVVPCTSKYFRRWVCVFGVEDLLQLAHDHHFYANKLMSEFDFAATTCLLERVYNRTHFPSDFSTELDLRPYLNLPQVRFHRRRLEGLDLGDFNCSEPAEFIRG